MSKNVQITFIISGCRYYRAALIVVLAFLAISLTTVGAKAQTTNERDQFAYRALAGLWSGSYRCGGSNDGGRVDLFVGKTRRLENGSLYKPYAVIRHYIKKDGALKLNNEIVAKIVTGGRSGLALQYINQGYAIVLKLAPRGNNRLEVDRSFCSKKPAGPLVLRKFSTPREPRQLFGLWRGVLIGCRFADIVKARMIITPFDGKRILIDMEYKFDRSEGRVVFVGTRDTRSNQFHFKELSANRDQMWGKRRDSKSTDWNPGKAVISLDAESGKLIVAAGSCTTGEFSAAVAKTTRSAQIPRPAPKPARPTISGIWEGRLKCGSRDRTNLDLKMWISKRIASRYRANLSTFERWSNSGSARWSSLLGQNEKTRDTYFFAKSGKSGQGLKGAKVRFLNLTHSSADRIVINLSDKNCRPISMTRLSPYAYTNRALLRPAKRSGSWYRARNPQERCQAVIDWGMNFLALSRANKKKTDYSLAYTDRAFIPFMGLPYDALSKKFLKQHYQKQMDYGRLCTSDPILRVRYEEIDRIYKEGFALGPRYQIYIARQVENNRVVNHKIALLKTKYRAAGNNGSLNDLEKIEKLLRDNDSLLWPNVKTTTRKWIASNKSIALDRQLASEIARVRRIKAPEDLLKASYAVASRKWQIKQLGQSRSTKLNKVMVQLHSSAAQALLRDQLDAIDLRPPWESALQSVDSVTTYLAALKKNMLANIYTRYASQLSEKRNRIVGSLINEYLVQLDQLDETDNGLAAASKIKTMMGRFSSKFSAFRSEPAFKKATVKLGNRYITTLAAPVSERLAQMDKLTASKSGLQASNEWLKRYKADFAAHENAFPVLAGQRKFWEIRHRLLRGAIKEFTKDLRKTPASGRQKLLDSYLSLPRDNRQPVSLEYRTILALSPRAQ